MSRGFRAIPPLVQALASPVVGVSLLAIVATVASLRLNGAMQLALIISTNNRWTGGLYGWTVRLDLLVVLAFVLGLFCLADTNRPALTSTKLLSARAGWTVGLVGAVVLGTAAWIGAPAGLVVGAIAAACVWLAPGLAREDSWSLPRPVVVGIALRSTTAIGLAAYAVRAHNSDIVFDDEQAYHFAALQVVPALVRASGDIASEWQHLVGFHLDMIAAIYALVGPHFFVVRVIEVAIGTLTVAVTFGITRTLFGARAAQAATWLVAIWPVLVFWSGSGVRDPSVWFVALLLPWLVTYRSLWVDRRQGVMLAFAIGLLAIVLLSSLRQYVALAGLIAVLIAGIGLPLPTRLRRQRLLVIGFLGLVVAGAGVAVVGQASTSLAAGPGELLAEFTPRAIEYRAAAMQLTPLLEQNHAKLPPTPQIPDRMLGYVVRVEVDDPPHLETGIIYWYYPVTGQYEVILSRDESHIIVGLPQIQTMSDGNVGWEAPLSRMVIGLGLLFVPTLPWTTSDTQRAATAPDTLIWDALVAAAGVSAWLQRKRLGAVGVLLLVYPAILIVGLPIISTNMGTVVRHRAMLVPWLAVIAAPLLIRLVARWRVARWLRLDEDRPVDQTYSREGRRAEPSWPPLPSR